uniref:Uncharacterized protein n=1 Tax=Rhizophora mucronata TaxID=61149 RepID=A0A2P2PZC9_RHIMU
MFMYQLLYTLLFTTGVLVFGRGFAALNTRITCIKLFMQAGIMLKLRSA